MRTSQSPYKTVAVLCLLLALLTACGQRGPLFLPNKKPAPAPAHDQKPVDNQKPEKAEDKNDAGH